MSKVVSLQVNNERLFAMTDGGRVIGWNTETGALLPNFVDDEPVCQIQFDLAKNRVCLRSNTCATILDSASGNALYRVRASSPLFFMRDYTEILEVRDDGTLAYRDLRNSQVNRITPKQFRRIRRIYKENLTPIQCFSTNGSNKLVFSGEKRSGEREVVVLNLNGLDGYGIRTIDLPIHPSGFAFSDQNSSLYVAYGNRVDGVGAWNTVVIGDLDWGHNVDEFNVEGVIMTLAVSEDTTLLGIIHHLVDINSESTTLTLRNLKDKIVTQIIPVKPARLLVVSARRGLSFLAAHSGMITVYRHSTGNVIAALPSSNGNVTSMNLSEKGLLIACYENGATVAWDFQEINKAD